MALHGNQFIRIAIKLGSRLAILSGLFWFVGVMWAPPWIKNQLVQYSQKLGYEIQIQSVAVKPFTLTAELEGLRLKKIPGEELFALDKGLIRLYWSKLLLGELTSPDQDRLEAKLNLKLDARILGFIFNLEPKQNAVQKIGRTTKNRMSPSNQ